MCYSTFIDSDPSPIAPGPIIPTLMDSRAFSIRRDLQPLSGCDIIIVEVEYDIKGGVEMFKSKRSKSDGRFELVALNELVKQIGGELGYVDEETKTVEVTLPDDPTRYKVNYVEFIQFQQKREREFSKRKQDYLTRTQLIVDICLFHMRDLGLVELDLETGMVKLIK